MAAAVALESLRRPRGGNATALTLDKSAPTVKLSRRCASENLSDSRPIGFSAIARLRQIADITNITGGQNTLCFASG